MSDYIIRLSNKEDIPYIRDLFESCFRACPEGSLDGIENGRYFVASYGINIFGVSGLKEEGSAKVLDWTCVSPQHQHKGIATTLLEAVCSLVNETVYCRAPRIGTMYNHLHSLLSNADFNLVWKNYQKSIRGLNCLGSCLNAKQLCCCNGREDKQCAVDLYQINLSNFCSVYRVKVGSTIRLYDGVKNELASVQIEPFGNKVRLFNFKYATFSRILVYFLKAVINVFTCDVLLYIKKDVGETLGIEADECIEEVRYYDSVLDCDSGCVNCTRLCSGGHCCDNLYYYRGGKNDRRYEGKPEVTGRV